jgi:hypothetical protein
MILTTLTTSLGLALSSLLSPPAGNPGFPIVPSLAAARASRSSAIDSVGQVAYLKASNTGNSDLFGCSMAASGNTLVVGARGESSNSTGVNGDGTNNGASGSGAAYVFVQDASGWSQQAYVKASNTGSGDNFGFAVAISGNTLVVGSPDEDSNATGVNGDEANNGATNSGAAYVFVRTGTTWTQQAYLKAPIRGAGHRFGYSVAISGDRIVVGAPVHDAAYFFVRNGPTWSFEQGLVGAGANAGISVAISGDTAVVGASHVNNSRGAAFVMVRLLGVWTQQAVLTASYADPGDLFGDAVSISGETVVVSAHAEDSDATGVNGDESNNLSADSGAVHVFVRDGSVWTQEAYVKASNAGTSDSFGRTLSISGDILVVGTQEEDSGSVGVNGNESDNTASNAGAAYVFTRDDSTWTQLAYVKASNTQGGDAFGSSVAASGTRIAVGASSEDSNGTGVNGDQSNNGASSAGAAYPFDLDASLGTSLYGTGTPGCAGTETLGVNHAPMINAPSFVITCDNAPPSSLGLGIVADAQDLTGSDPFAIGVLLHVNLFTATEVLTFDFVSDGLGYGATVNTGIPNSAALIGKTYYVMALWFWTSCSLPPNNLSTSRGLALTIQAP